MMKILIFFLIFFLMSFTMQLHPFFASIQLILMSITVIFLINSISEHWLNFIFILVYLGGILIIFVYTSSAIPNLLSFEPNKLMFLGLTFTIIFPMNFMLKTITEINSFTYFNVLNSSWMMILLFFSFLLFVLIFSVNLMWQKSIPMRGI